MTEQGEGEGHPDRFAERLRKQSRTARDRAQELRDQAEELQHIARELTQEWEAALDRSNGRQEQSEALAWQAAQQVSARKWPFER